MIPVLALPCTDFNLFHPFDRFLYALGIRHIGELSAQLIAKEFQEFSLLWAYLNNQKGFL
jgi:NAD-dependent DNA ligase